MKICTKCHQEKKLTEYYPDRGTHSSKSGLCSWCKPCQKKQRKIYLQSAKGKFVIRKYSKTEISKSRQKRYCLRHPERRKAKNAVYLAIQNSELPRPSALKCYCGNQAEQYHHPSYVPEHWLDVIPVCRKHHRLLHQPEEQENG